MLKVTSNGPAVQIDLTPMGATLTVVKGMPAELVEQQVEDLFAGMHRQLVNASMQVKVELAKAIAS